MSDVPPTLPVVVNYENGWKTVERRVDPAVPDVLPKRRPAQPDLLDWYDAGGYLDAYVR